MGHSKLMRSLLLFVIGSVIFLSCPDFVNSASQRIEYTYDIFVAIPPMAWMAEELIKDGNVDININVLLPPGKSPATYDPTPSEITDLLQTYTYFKIGLPFEKVLFENGDGILDEERIADCTKGIALRRIEDGHGHDHNHNDGHDEQFDPHVWLDPVNAKIIIRNMMLNITRIFLHDTYDKLQKLKDNHISLRATLDTLNMKIAEILEPYRGDTIFVFHPAFGYFTDRYGLHQVAIELEGHEPSGKHLADLVEQVKKANAKAIFVQPEFSDKAARAIADELGLKVVYLDPLARDYPENMLKIAHAIADALKADN